MERLWSCCISCQHVVLAGSSDQNETQKHAFSVDKCRDCSCPSAPTVHAVHNHICSYAYVIGSSGSVMGYAVLELVHLRHRRGMGKPMLLSMM